MVILITYDACDFRSGWLLLLPIVVVFQKLRGWLDRVRSCMGPSAPRLRSYHCRRSERSMPRTSDAFHISEGQFTHPRHNSDPSSVLRNSSPIWIRCKRPAFHCSLPHEPLSWWMSRVCHECGGASPSSPSGRIALASRMRDRAAYALGGRPNSRLNERSK